MKKCTAMRSLLLFILEVEHFGLQRTLLFFYIMNVLTCLALYLNGGAQYNNMICPNFNLFKKLSKEGPESSLSFYAGAAKMKSWFSETVYGTSVEHISNIFKPFALLTVIIVSLSKIEYAFGTLHAGFVDVILL